MGKKSAQTKNALADALVSILLDNEPGAITVKAVAKTADVDRQTFYYHFEGMEGLIGYLSEREVGALAMGLEKDLSLDELEMDTEQLSCFLVDSFRQHLIGLAATKGQI